VNDFDEELFVVFGAIFLLLMYLVFLEVSHNLYEISFLFHSSIRLIFGFSDFKLFFLKTVKYICFSDSAEKFQTGKIIFQFLNLDFSQLFLSHNDLKSYELFQV
jgi:hypothetical protein